MDIARYLGQLSDIELEVQSFKIFFESKVFIGFRDVNYLPRSRAIDNVFNDRCESRPTSKFVLARSSNPDFCLFLIFSRYRAISSAKTLRIKMRLLKSYVTPDLALLKGVFLATLLRQYHEGLPSWGVQLSCFFS